MGYAVWEAAGTPVDLRPGDAFPMKVVAVVGLANEWVVYQGHSDWTDAKVASYGDKLLRETAKLLF